MTGLVTTVCGRAIAAKWAELPEVDSASVDFDKSAAYLTVRLYRTLKVSVLRKTLRRYYHEKQALYGRKTPLFFDRDLRRLFVSGPALGRHEKAGRYLRRRRMEFTSIIARWTGEYRYRIDQVLHEMIRRCDELHLRVLRDDPPLQLELVALLTRLVMDYLHSGRYRVTV